MRINNIIKFNLETRAKELRFDGNSFDDIAHALSEESGQSITKSTVYRYFESNDMVAAQVIENTNKLKVKVVDAEISTIEKRLEIIDKFLSIAEEAQSEGDFKSAIVALRGATEAQDSLDERLGKLKPAANTNNINIINFQEAVTNARGVLASRIDGIASRVRETGDSK